MTDSINTIKAVVSDKEALLKELLRRLDESAKAMWGLETASPTVLSNESEANTRKMLNTTMKIVPLCGVPIRRPAFEVASGATARISCRISGRMS
jgi:hypothetical protein